jgi:hypothetical protein
MSKQKRKPSVATQRPAKTNVDTQKNDINNRYERQSPTGANAAYAERRLRKNRPDLYALSQLLRSDRKRTGGWVRLGKLKGAYA